MHSPRQESYRSKAGLFLNAHTETEFASVMAHEIAHVSKTLCPSVDEAQSGRSIK